MEESISIGYWIHSIRLILIQIEESISIGYQIHSIRLILLDPFYYFLLPFLLDSFYYLLLSFLNIQSMTPLTPTSEARRGEAEPSRKDLQSIRYLSYCTGINY